jgi:hypothetical protein
MVQYHCTSRPSNPSPRPECCHQILLLLTTSGCPRTDSIFLQRQRQTHGVTLCQLLEQYSKQAYKADAPRFLISKKGKRSV